MERTDEPAIFVVRRARRSQPADGFVDVGSTSMRSPILDNIIWHSLSGAQAPFASGTDSIRRYARGFSGIVGAIAPQQPDLDALAPFCDVGEAFYLAGWTGQVPAGWQIQAEAELDLYLWNAAAPAPEPDVDAERLGPQHVPQMLDLVALTRPGPFAQRTIELGEYYGVFDAGRLVAMAGERMQADRFREVSGVCTHPDFQGRGLARGLMHRLIRQQLQRGQTPFLHVMAANGSARAMYERMGFAHYLRSPVRVIARADSS